MWAGALPDSRGGRLKALIQAEFAEWNPRRPTVSKRNPLWAAEWVVWRGSWGEGSPVGRGLRCKGAASWPPEALPSLRASIPRCPRERGGQVVARPAGTQHCPSHLPVPGALHLNSSGCAAPGSACLSQTLWGDVPHWRNDCASAWSQCPSTYRALPTTTQGRPSAQSSPRASWASQDCPGFRLPSCCPQDHTCHRTCTTGGHRPPNARRPGARAGRSEPGTEPARSRLGSAPHTAS